MESIENRRSVRSFNDKIISDDDINYILNMGILAPSAHNLQPWEFKIITNIIDKEKINELMISEVKKQGLNDKFYLNTMKAIRECSHLIIVFNNNSNDKNVILSLGACVTNMIMVATSIGIGSLWIGHTDIIEENIVSIFGKDGLALGTVVALGYSDNIINPDQGLLLKIR